ncbi:MAG: hypothetical protein KW806_01210 [Candidatus Yanofskybacteria bacterium]|nr:hypothetical protein [Candidatus Yanofskybacteria bacterium]
MAQRRVVQVVSKEERIGRVFIPKDMQDPQVIEYFGRLQEEGEMMRGPRHSRGHLPSLAQQEREGDPLETLRRANPDEERFLGLTSRFDRWPH